jgi:ATP-dependent DNA helicase RecQ
MYVFSNPTTPISTMTTMSKDPVELLQNVFGYSAFIGKQEEIIRHVLGGGDGVVLMPTGGGKSVCYQIPAIILPGTAIVVSPLIALMRDQVQGLLQMGVRAGCLNSSLSMQEARETEERLAEGKLDLVYVAPERLLTDRFWNSSTGSASPWWPLTKPTACPSGGMISGPSTPGCP